MGVGGRSGLEPACGLTTCWLLFVSLSDVESSCHPYLGTADIREVPSWATWQEWFAVTAEETLSVGCGQLRAL